MKIDEDNFITQVKHKNSEALDFIVDEYSNIVFKIIRTVLNSNFYFQYVEECANDVFWSVWSNIDSFDENKGNFKHWIAAISKYKAIDYKRKLFKQNNIESIDDHILCADTSIENDFILNENKEEIFEVMNYMKKEDQEIFIRRYFLDEKVENIAKILGVNRNLIDKRLSRGRKFLKEKLILLKGEIL
ncbi:sigma-70 family RNA polymerase sigma factor [Clostridium botulinum]|uniref:Sigma-70 family RNA polymerase sigma factor n=2 Tax=Clostridium botulinum TaxID=1491 RepID=A0A846I790_CLOBO|nr:sigma-70 family RNA polymerase sigma factor [Clostridium botulinum]EPS48140.1 RNA polymerase factor sigma-70 [Clostridium botulinum A1 str. CFSAN002368]ACQ51595.1 RNA polymerase sigma-70 factor family [Clostridium botulinum Ba4 str. 657]AJE11873.1 RNA polymerase sigma factor, sigma-70 family protein [Clostridium botulinum CDC_1436]APR00652.1 RNA polymerase sigma factor, sigma-70 family protein [Clostridium botulinum]APU58936.1 RNA polymerase sigma factor, sigma-70 family protein [Clostridiu